MEDKISNSLMEHIYIKDNITNRSLWITNQQEDGIDYHTMLTDGMLFRERIKESKLRKTIRDWMKWVPTLDKVEGIEFMELHEYTGEPTQQEMEQRLAFWNSWSPKHYKDNHLRINHPCPCCGSDEDTEWIRQEWSICYNCFIAFTLDDLIPVHDPSILQPYDPDEEV